MGGALHLIKLSVGSDSVDDLASWQAGRVAERRVAGLDARPRHVTRMWPRRAPEILGGGSLYWVVKGQVACRQPLTGIRPFTDPGGIGRCHLVLEPVVIPVQPRPCRPFQGWRYLEAKDAPADLGPGLGDVAAMPEGLRRELADLGLL